MKVKYYAYMRYGKDGKEQLCFISDDGQYFKFNPVDKRKYIFSTVLFDPKRNQVYIERENNDVRN